MFEFCFPHLTQQQWQKEETEGGEMDVGWRIGQPPTTRHIDNKVKSFVNDVIILSNWFETCFELAIVMQQGWG